MHRRTYIPALLRQSLKAAGTNRLQFAFLGSAMFAQNAIFFLVWIVFFGTIHDVKGWRLSDLALFQGILCMGIGGAFFLAEGSRHLAERIRDGELDTYLIRPRHPLPQLISLDINASSLGDLVYGAVLVLATRPGVEELLLALVLAVCVGTLYVALVITFQSLAFFINGGGRLADELFMTMICLGSVPQHTEGVLMKIVLFSVLPAGFVAIVPLEVIREHSLLLLGLMVGAVTVYAGIAVALFHAGLKRYTSATGWQA